MLVPISDIKTFSSVFPDSDDIATSVSETAESIVTEFLGYDPLTADRIDIVPGLGDDTLTLKAFPVASSVVIDGESHDNYIVDKNTIRLTGFFFEYGKRYRVEYTAGYEEAEVPAIIKHTILRIASILLQESGGNIGVTGTTDQNTGSRTFINYTNFEKYLSPLKPFRLHKALV